MRFSKLFLASLAPAGLLADASKADRELDLDEYLARHNLALVPRSDLTEVLAELHGLLKKKNGTPQQRGSVPRLWARQNMTIASVVNGQEAGQSESASNAATSASNEATSLLEPSSLLAPTSLTSDTSAGSQSSAAGPGSPTSAGAPSNTPKPPSGSGSGSGTGAGTGNGSGSGQTIDLGDLGDLIPGLDNLGQLIEGLNRLFEQIGNFGDLFNAISKLLTDEFINALHDAMIYLSSLLAPPIWGQTREIITIAYPLLQLVSKLDLEGLISEIEGIDIKGIISALAPILKPATIELVVNLLTNAGNLLTSDNVDLINSLLQILPILLNSLGNIDITGLIDALTPLLTPATIQSVEALLTNAGNLLTADNVDLINSLLQILPILLNQLGDIDIGGVIDALKPLLTAETINSLVGLLGNAGNLLTTDNVELINSLLQILPILLNQLGDIDIGGVIEALKPLLTAETINSLVGLLNNASALLTTDNVDLLNSVLAVLPILINQLGNIDIGGIIDAIGPLLTPESIQGLIGLLKNAEDLLTADSVTQLKGLLSSLGQLDLEGLIAQLKPLLDAVSQIDLAGLLLKLSLCSRLCPSLTWLACLMLLSLCLLLRRSRGSSRCCPTPIVSSTPNRWLSSRPCWEALLAWILTSSSINSLPCCRLWERSTLLALWLRLSLCSRLCLPLTSLASSTPPSHSLLLRLSRAS